MKWSKMRINVWKLDKERQLNKLVVKDELSSEKFSYPKAIVYKVKPMFQERNKPKDPSGTKSKSLLA